MNTLIPLIQVPNSDAWVWATDDFEIARVWRVVDGEEVEDWDRVAGTLWIQATQPGNTPRIPENVTVLGVDVPPPNYIIPTDTPGEAASYRLTIPIIKFIVYDLDKCYAIRLGVGRRDGRTVFVVRKDISEVARLP